MPNPVSLTINPGENTGFVTGHITGTTNAGLTHQAKVAVIDATGKVVAHGIFQGEGKNNEPLPLLEGGSVLSYSNARLPLALYVQFNYSNSGSFIQNDPDNVVASQLFDTGKVEVLQMISEDNISNSFNDLVLTSVNIKH